MNLYSGTSATGPPVTPLTAPVAATARGSRRARRSFPTAATPPRSSRPRRPATPVPAPRGLIRFDATGPEPTLTTPADGATTDDRTPTLAGTGGTALGDNATVTVAIYSGSGFRHAARDVSRRVGAGGAWSTEPGGDLANGTYTAVTTQADDVGHTGQSPPNTFSVERDTVLRGPDPRRRPRRLPADERDQRHDGDRPRGR